MTVANRLQQLIASLGIVYHYTSIYNALQILQENRFRLSTNIGTTSDQGIGNMPYFLSLTRNKTGHYHKGAQSGAMLVLNPDYLASHGKLGPVDYWGPEYRKLDPQRHEMEERLWSNKQYIKLAKPITNLIYGIHLILDDNWPEHNFQLRRLLIMAKSLHIPTYVYKSPKDWLLQRKNKALPLQDFKTELAGPEILPSQRNRDYTEHWRELYFAIPGKTKLSKTAERKLESIRYSYNNDAYNSLMADIHNEKGNPNINKLVKLVRKHGDGKGFIQYLADKFK